MAEPLRGRIKIISGGQTGADRTALEVARELGFPTGGVAPLFFKTENGPDLTLRDVFGLSESQSPSYSVRTKANVQIADVTVWLGKTGSAGYVCTKKAIDLHKRPFVLCPSADELLEWVLARRPKTVNIAGNRRSHNPGIVRLTRETLLPVLIALLQEELLLDRLNETENVQ
jgi:hypothetical protein